MSWRGELPAACWDRDEALAIIPVEAESTSNGVFLATHSSIPITLRDQVHRSASAMATGIVVNEHALLQAVQEQPADQPIIPILGRSGTGKSHLVRWLRINLSTKDSTRMIFVPKHRMSLRGILELILEHATGERADELRAKVATAVEGFASDNEAMLRLLFALSVLVETRGASKNDTPEETELRAYLAAPTGLPALLSDQVFRARLLHDTGPIARLVREKLSGKGAEDKEDAFGFSAEDLKLSVDDVSRAGAAAREIASALTSDGELRILAAAMLNDQLGPAVGEVFGIGGDDLKKLLDELRLELGRQGLELLLLIEDFSIFQGIQGGLIDAITMIPTEDHDICPMRVVMAVTTGYFMNQMPETVFTRTYKAFDLEIADGKRTNFDKARFATRYLNAVRVGSAVLDDVHASESSIPNACEQCPVNDACHAAFGEVDGHGLFPFNRAALDRAIDSQTKEGEFIARDVLTRVLRPVLHRDKTEIDAGRFPSSAFADDFAAGARGILSNVEETVQLTTGSPDDTDRRIRLVKFWGGGGPQNLPPTIHDAFAIPMVQGLGSSDTAGPRPGPNLRHDAGSGSTSISVQGNDRSAPERRRQVPALVQAVDRWRETGDLIQSDRSRLRTIVHSAVCAYLNLDDGLSGDGWWTNASGKKHLVPAFEAVSGIALDDSKLGEALLPINRKDDTSVRVLRALAWLDDAEDWTSIEKGDELQRLCDRQVRRWAATISQKLMPARDRRDDPELARLAHALLAISKALGIPGAFKADGYNRAKALFANPPTFANPQSRPLLRKWQESLANGTTQRLSRESLQQRLLRLASYSQGTGKPLGLELSRLTCALRDGNSDSPWPTDTPDIVTESCAHIAIRIEALDELRDEALALVPDISDVGEEVAAVSAALNSLLTGLSMGGLLPSGIDQAGIAAAGKAVKLNDRRTVEKIRVDLLRWSDLSSDERLSVLTDDWDMAAAAVRCWLQAAVQALDLVEQRLTSNPASQAQQDYDRARTDLADALTDLAVSMADIDGSEDLE